MKKDFQAAARVLRDNCEAHGHGESCYKLGAYQAIGKGGHSRGPAAGLAAFPSPGPAGAPRVSPQRPQAPRARRAGTLPPPESRL